MPQQAGTGIASAMAPSGGSISDDLPKTGKSKDWLAYADQQLKAFKDYHSQVNMFGQLKHPDPLGDDYSRILSDHEVQARNMGMQLLRNEMKQQQQSESKVPNYKTGGKVRKTGLARLHKGERVIPARKPKRSSGR
jgi:hypothetical protein